MRENRGFLIIVAGLVLVGVTSWLLVAFKPAKSSAVAGELPRKTTAFEVTRLADLEGRGGKVVTLTGRVRGKTPDLGSILVQRPSSAAAGYR